MLETILTLLNAGYTREEISQLLATPASGAGDSTDTHGDNNPVVVPDPSAPAAPAGGNPVPAAPVASGAADLGGIYAALESMSKNIVTAIQRAQLGGASMPTPAATPQEQMDAITAQIINPTNKKGE